MNRRGFLKGLFGLVAGGAAIKALPEKEVYTHKEYALGIPLSQEAVEDLVIDIDRHKSSMHPLHIKPNKLIIRPDMHETAMRVLRSAM